MKVLDINPTTDEWMILACDGIWNFMSSQEVLLPLFIHFLSFFKDFFFLASIKFRNKGWICIVVF